MRTVDRKDGETAGTANSTAVDLKLEVVGRAGEQSGQELPP